MSLLKRILSGELPADAEIVSERLLRRVFRFRLGDGREAFAKQHLFPVLRVRLRYALRASPTRAEAERLAEAAKRGLRVPRVLAERSVRSLCGPRLAVLVTEALPAKGVASHAERIASVSRLAELGIEHPDLHPDNVLRLEDGELGFLDFQSVRFRVGPVGGRALLRMQAKAAEAAFAELGAEPLRELLESQLGKEAAARATAELERVRASQRASRRRHALRSSSRFEQERHGLGWTVRLRGEELPKGPEQGARELALGEGVRGEIWAPRLLRVSSRPGPLREMWLRAALGEEPKDATFLAYGRDAPWPWAREHLYIRPSRTLGGDADALACWKLLGSNSG